jgi:uncharacterized protein (TIGR00725 family)
MTDKGGYSTKYKICVSGAAETSHCGQDAFDQAEKLGREIARQGAVLINGATTGFPYWASKGAKSENGIVQGISPAYSEWEHINVYKLPVDYQDFIMYTGQGYSGRNLLLTRSADAVIVGCGRIGTLNEFTVAFEDRKPIGILQGDWDTDIVIKTIIEKSHRAEEMKDKIIYSRDPKELVSKLIALIAVERANAESDKKPL